MEGVGREGMAWRWVDELFEGCMPCMSVTCCLAHPLFMHGFSLLENEVIWGHIDILVVAVRRLSRRWKVKTLLAGPSPTSSMKRRLPTLAFLIHYGAFRTGSLGKSVAKRISYGLK